ncbi:hypothetical protein WH47_05451 [Habropoda laboriosa]|uniref:Uncharacterized protein n=1 Tax=Habropoda laboriosa TaxID=597456 RepID=A0A0L7RFA3_9HYME|nr:hypothetical protein WH47_05451 [Habropoda laboriosa]
MSSQSVNGPPYWEHILREFVFKTVSPPPQGNHQLYKRLLDAPFYAGPFPFPTTDSATVLVLSRGDVYHLANGHWLFCQQGCFDCEVCSEHTHPAVKWILRRIKRISSHGSPRHDLQLTILPQVDGSYHMKSLWPRSYVYVTSQGEQDAYFNDRRYYRNDGTAYANHTEDDSSGQGRTGRNFWTFVDRNSLSDRSAVGTQVPEKRVIGGNDSSDSSKEHVDNNNKENVESTSVRVRQLIPKLILGTDHLGQKHLVHVVPADASTNTSLVNSAVSNGLNSAGQNRTAYQRILRRIYDSLSSNRRSIESFLDPSKQAGQVNQQSEEHQQQETRSGLAGLKQTGRFYPIHDRGARNKSSLYERWPYTLNWSRQRDKSNDDVFPERFINNTSNIGHRLSNPGIQNNLANLTLHRDMRNKNASDRIRSKLIDNDSLKMGNVTRKFIPRKYKIVVTTESTTKLSDITNDREIIQNRGYLTPGNQNVTSR